jgi:S-layer protein
MFDKNQNTINLFVTLTDGIDILTGTNNNDTFSSVSGNSTLTTLDTIDGGNGTDTLSVTAVQQITSEGVTVRNVEAAVLTSGADVNVDTSAWTGLKTLTVNSAGANNAGQTFTAATTTSLNITNSTDKAVTIIGGGGAIAVSTGGNVDVGQTAVANAITSVTVVGAANGTVKIQDRSGEAAVTGTTLTTVSLDGQGGASTLTGDAISTINSARTGADVTVAAAAGTRALAINLDDVLGGIYTDATATAVTVTSTGAASELADLAVASAKSVTLSGSKALTLADTHFDKATSLTINGSALTTVSKYSTTNELTGVTITGAGGFSSNLSTQTELAKIDASASTGANKLTINDETSYLGGSGVDTVTAAAAPTLTVDGGAGANDVFVVNAASFSLSKVVNFETLGAGGLATGAYSAAGFTNLTQGAVSGAITWNSVAAGTGLTFTASPTQDTTYNLKTDTSADVLNLTMKSSGAMDGKSLTATTVETVNISLVDSDSTKHVNTLKIVDTALKTLVITGNAGLTLTNTDTTVTSVDASAVTNTAGTAATGLSWTTGALAGASTIKGTSTGGDVIDAALAAKAVTITAYAGTNTITGSSTVGSTLTGGSGADTINGGDGIDTIVGGGGKDVITGGAGADSITLSGSTSAFSQFAQTGGASGANNATSNQTNILTSTFDVIRGVVAGTEMKLDGAANTTLNKTAANLAGTDGEVNFARGTYDAANGIFTYGAAGADTAVTYDTNAQQSPFETVILVGYVSASGTDLNNGVITFA